MNFQSQGKHVEKSWKRSSSSLAYSTEARNEQHNKTSTQFPELATRKYRKKTSFCEFPFIWNCLPTYPSTIKNIKSEARNQVESKLY